MKVNGKPVKFLSQSGYWRSGNPRLYVRRARIKRIPLPDVIPDSKDFWSAYKMAVHDAKIPKRKPKQHEELAIKLAKKALKRAKVRSYEKGRPLTITEQDVLRMLFEQRFRCALTGILFDDYKPESSRRMPFAPSLDRIDCAGGYVPGNVRLVCAIVNVAISDFGDHAFEVMCKGMRTYRG